MRGQYLTHDAPAQPAVVFPPGDVEGPGAGGAQLDQVLTHNDQSEASILNIDQSEASIKNIDQ